MVSSGGRKRGALLMAMLVMAAVAAGCGYTGTTTPPAGEAPAKPDNEATPSGRGGPSVLKFLDLWNGIWAQVADPRDWPLGQIRLSNQVGKPEVVQFIAIWEQRWPRAYVSGRARKDDGGIFQIELRWDGKLGFDDKDLAERRPFFESLIGVVDQSLTREDREALLRELRLGPGDLPALRQVGKHVVVKNAIEYLVELHGSSEGTSVRLRATIRR